MLKLEDLDLWLRNGGFRAPFRQNRQPDSPDEVVTLTDTGGFGTEAEGLLTNPTFQTLVRGPKDDAKAARDLAYDLHRRLLDAPWPFDLAGTRVFDVGLVGGDPSYLNTDSKGRTEYVCNYRLKVER